MKIIVTFSGGKDSLAALLWVRNNMTKNFTTVFCDTGWESPITYKYIEEVNQKLSLNLITLKSKKYNGMIDLAAKKGRFPSTKARFCTVELKSKPMVDYLLDEVKEHCLVIQGIRGDESSARALMNKQCRYFKYYFEPYQTNEMIVERLSKLPVLSLAQKRNLKKAQDRLAKGKNDEKFHTYRKKEVFEFCEKYMDDLLRPVFDKTAQWVIDYSITNGIDPNPLYKMAMSRVGCFPCIMCTLEEVKQIDNRFPERIDFIIEQEDLLGTTFFKPDAIPERFRTGITINKKGETVRFTRAIDIRNYVRAKDATLDLFQTEPTSCMSFYGICE